MLENNKKGFLASLMWAVVFMAVLAGLAVVYANTGSDNGIDVRTFEVSKVQMQERVFNFVNRDYTGTENELLFCLEGVMSGDKAVVTNFFVPQVILSEDKQITFKGCKQSKTFFEKFMDRATRNPERILGTVHSHSPGICHPSSKDILDFGLQKHLLLGIICGNREIVFYTQSSLPENINFEVVP